MKKENILQALNYIIDNERQSYKEFLSEENKDNTDHIYTIALMAKSDLCNIIIEKT